MYLNLIKRVYIYIVLLYKLIKYSKWDGFVKISKIMEWSRETRGENK